MPKRQLSDTSIETTIPTANDDKKNPQKRKSSRTLEPVNYDESDAQLNKLSKISKVVGTEVNAAGKALPKKDVAPDDVEVIDERMSIPGRNGKGELVFDDYPYFTPNLTPKEILQMGSFGGTYFRPITSKVTGESYKDVWKELPPDWLEGLDIKTQIASPKYNKSLNRYKETCGGDLEMWESSGWITKIDPYGWFMWYCRCDIICVNDTQLHDVI